MRIFSYSAASLLAAVTVALALQGAARADNDCGSLANSFGPFDYRSARKADKQVVESHHFDANVESLKRGVTDTRIAHDIDYTLRVFPNHPRALWAISRLSLREKRNHLPGANYTVDCYFDRAIRFQPDDARVRLVYGLHLVREGKRENAVDQLEKAGKLGENVADIRYNLGLAYFDLKNYDRALAEAKLAYGMGFPLPGLRDKLKSVGKWQD
ncbi:MAG: ABC transporter permease [Burkholderiales bacterium]